MPSSPPQGQLSETKLSFAPPPHSRCPLCSLHSKAYSALLPFPQQSSLRKRESRSRLGRACPSLAAPLVRSRVCPLVFLEHLVEKREVARAPNPSFRPACLSLFLPLFMHHSVADASWSLKFTPPPVQKFPPGLLLVGTRVLRVTRRACGGPSHLTHLAPRSRFQYRWLPVRQLLALNSN